MRLLGKENQSRNGVRVIVYRYENGTIVDARCQCFGTPFRLHSDEYCPNRLNQLKVAH